MKKQPDCSFDPLVSKAGVLVEALPYIKKFNGTTFVIKYGGAAQIDPALKEAFAADVTMLSFIGVKPVIIHGGGPKISAIMERMGLKPQFIHGHRVTDAETMEIVEMVLGGLVNKEIVALINLQGGKAVGLSGKDGNLIVARKKRLAAPGKEEEEDGIDIGLVGQVTQVNHQVLEALDKEGFVPVIAPIGVGAQGEPYNINGDDVTTAIAASLKAEKLIYLTDTNGIMDKDGKTIPTISRAQAKKLMANGTISGGMLPKINAALSALDAGVRKVHIVDGRVPHCLLLEIFTNEGIGTEVVQ